MGTALGSVLVGALGTLLFVVVALLPLLAVGAGWLLIGLALRRRLSALDDASWPAGQAQVVSKEMVSFARCFPRRYVQVDGAALGGLGRGLWVQVSAATYASAGVGGTVVLRRLPGGESLPYVEGDRPTVLHAYPVVEGWLKGAAVAAMVLGGPLVVAVGFRWDSWQRGLASGSAAPDDLWVYLWAELCMWGGLVVWALLSAAWQWRGLGLLRARGRAAEATVVDRACLMSAGPRATPAKRGWVSVEWTDASGVQRRRRLLITRGYSETRVGGVIPITYVQPPLGRSARAAPLCVPAGDPGPRSTAIQMTVVALMAVVLLAVHAALFAGIAGRIRETEAEIERIDRIIEARQAEEAQAAKRTPPATRASAQTR